MITNSKWTGPIGKLLDIPAIRQDGGPARTPVYNMVKNGTLEAVKVGTRLKITERSYEAYKEALPRGMGASPFARGG
jgi:hypothetical protein